MGEVYLATAQGAAGFEKLVALKLLPDRHRGDEESRQSLWREALLGAQLDHQGIVQVLDLGEDSGRLYIALEYVRGVSLGRLVGHVERGGSRYDVRSAVQVARQIADALSYLHTLTDEAGAPLALVHGDVSASNVLLAVDGRIKLSDFGIAAFEEDDITVRGKLAGKLSYLPPEAFSGAARAQSWDVYSLAVTLYRVIAGEQPFPGKTLDEVRDALERGALPVAELRPDCPPALAALLDRALGGQEDRLRSAAEFRSALDAAFPRRVDDREHHATYVKAIYEQDDFLAEHGELPASGAADASLNPEVYEATEAVTVAQRGKKPLRFGISPAHGANVARELGKRLSELLGDRLGRGVRAVPFADYAALEDCLVHGEVDFAWMPPAAFVLAAERGAGLVAVAQRYGRPSFESAIVVRADARLSRLEDLRGGSMAWVDRSSAAGYLFAAAEVHRRLGPPAEVFERQHFHGSHPAVCEAVANGWADAGATYVVRDDGGRVMRAGWLDLSPDRSGELHTMLISGPIPGDNIAHRPDLSPAVVGELVTFWTGLGAEPAGKRLLAEVFGADAFVPADLDLYENVRRALELASGGGRM